MIKTLSAIVLGATLLAAAPAHALTTALDVNVDLGAEVTSSTSAATEANITTDVSAQTGSTIELDINLPTNVSSEADVKTYSDALIKSDTNVSSVDSSADEVSVSYKERLHVFGFIPVWGTVKSTVRADGTVEVRYPWYSFLSSTSRAEVESRVQNSVDVALKDRTETGSSFSARTQAGLIAAMRAALKTSYEADVAAEASADVK